MEAPVSSSEETQNQVNPPAPAKEFIFNTGHEPINTLSYVNVKITDQNISSVKVFGSTNKNISFLTTMVELINT